jgi:hypothetical protein
MEPPDIRTGQPAISLPLSRTRRSSKNVWTSSIGVPGGVRVNSCCLIASSDWRTLILILSSAASGARKAQNNIATVITRGTCIPIRECGILISWSPPSRIAFPRFISANYQYMFIEPCEHRSCASIMIPTLLNLGRLPLKQRIWYRVGAFSRLGTWESCSPKAVCHSPPSTHKGFFGPKLGNGRCFVG